MMAEITKAPWQGRLQVRYGRKGDRTVALHPFCQAPLKLQQPFYPLGHSGPCCHVLLHTAGGIVGGDRLDYALELEPGARALLTTAAAGKVYRSSGATAMQDVRVAIAPEAYLTWLPQETIVFAEADFTQTMRVDLAPGGLFCGWEVTRLGRSARGEQFLAGCWRSRLEVWQGSLPLWIDRQVLRGSPELWASPVGLAGQPVVATLLWIGQPIAPEILERCQAIAPPTGSGGVTQTLGSGLVARYRGDSTAAAQAWFFRLWQELDAGAAALQPHLQRLGLPGPAQQQQPSLVG